MPEEVKLNTSCNVIEVDSYGSVSKEDSLISLETIKRLLEESGVKSVLVDVRKQTVSNPKAANIAAFAAALPRGVRIAMVYSKHHPNDGAFTFMTSAAICNSVNMRMFNCKDAALEWFGEIGVGPQQEAPSEMSRETQV